MRARIAVLNCGVLTLIIGSSARRDEAIHAAVSAIRSGEIVAIRGLGGYQLLVDATNESAVRRLRERKKRRSKPLAVMTQSMQQAGSLAKLDQAERDALTDPSNPIVICTTKGDSPIAESVHPNLGLRRLDVADHSLACTSGP